MKLTYSIQVCNESRELYSLINFLIKVKDEEDNIHVVVDSLHKTDKVQLVLDYFKDNISVFERPFDNFSANANFHLDMATGDYGFSIDADEMPQEMLIKNIKNVLAETGGEIVWVPRINIHPGATSTFINGSKFNVNESGWINWPDYQGRIYKKCDYVRWSDEQHPKLFGSDKAVALQPKPEIAMWHIKSIEKQESRWANKIDISFPDFKNLYDQLM